MRFPQKTQKSILRPNPFQRTLFYIVVAGLALLSVLPPTVMNLFVPYSAAGGNPIIKIHIGSYLILFAFLCVVFQRGSVQFVIEQFQTQFLIFMFALTVGAVALIMTISQGTSGLAYMVDTLLLPPLAIMTVSYLKPQQRFKLVQLIVLFVLCNALIAIFERLISYNFYPMPWTFSGLFRASAFLGHPLNNALITTGVMFVAAALPIRFVYKAVMLSILALGSGLIN